MSARRKPVAGKKVVAWLLVDRHGFPDQVYGRLGHPSLSPKRRAEKAAIRMNACGPSPDQDKFGPWRAQRIEYVLPSRPKKGRAR